VLNACSKLQDLNFFYSAPIGQRSIVMTVCVCVCPLTYLRNYTSLPIFVHVTYGRGSVLLWRRRDTLCTSGFVDDVVLAHRPRQLNVAAQLIEAALDLAINGA